MRELFVKVLESLRSRYLLTYYPAGVGTPGWHPVAVRLRGARGTLTTRPGYYIPPP